MSRVYFSFFLVYNKSITGGILEEKLYFAPADYGKGAHKRKEKQEKKKEGKNYRAIKLGGFLLFLAIIVAVIIWLLHGKTTTTGQYPENLKSESLECTSSEIEYLKYRQASPDNKELKIVAVFNGEENLSSIDLRYTINFKTNIEATQAEAVLHAEFNTSLQKLNYSPEKFNNKFTVIDNKLIISLHATKADLDDFAKSYFLIETSQDEPKGTIQEYQDNYEKKYFSCKNSINQND